MGSFLPKAYGIKLVLCYHTLGIEGEGTTLICSKIQNIETESGSFRSGHFGLSHFGLSHFGQFLVVTTLIIGSFRSDFEVGRWALSRLVKTSLVIV